MPELPVCVRIDGRSFHNFTRGFQRPFDQLLSNLFQYTTKTLVKAKWTKSGTYFKRVTFTRTLTAEELAKIPERHRSAASGPKVRFDVIAWPYELGKVHNKVEAVFRDQKPILLSDLPAVTV